MSKLQRKHLYFTLALISALFLIFLRKQPWEYILIFTTGLFLGSSFKDKLKLIVILSIFVYLVAAIFDPILKPILDSAFTVSTVTFNTSIKVNTVLLLLFWLGLYLGRKEIGIKKQ